jgi:hypothetical protein
MFVSFRIVEFSDGPFISGRVLESLGPQQEFGDFEEFADCGVLHRTIAFLATSREEILCGSRLQP